MAVEGISAAAQMIQGQGSGQGNFGFAKGVLEAMKRGGSAEEIKFVDKVSKDVEAGKIGSAGESTLTQAGGPKDFGEMLANEVKKINATEHAFKQEQRKVLTGESDNLHRLQMLRNESMTMLKVQKAFHRQATDFYKAVWNLNV